MQNLIVFAEEHVTWTDDNWAKIHIGDESVLNLGRDNFQSVSRSLLNSEEVSVMVWGMLSAVGVGILVRLNGKINSNVYQYLLHQHDVLPLLASPNQPANFMQDNTSCHTAKCVKKFLHCEGIEILKWQAQSPDLNLIYNLWKIIGEKVVAKKNIHNYWIIERT